MRHPCAYARMYQTQIRKGFLTPTSRLRLTTSESPRLSPGTINNQLKTKTMKTESFRSSLRQFILSLPIDGEHRLSSIVRVSNNSMVGYGDICGVCRYGKRGGAYCFDVIDQLYPLSKLSESECKAILTNL